MWVCVCVQKESVSMSQHDSNHPPYTLTIATLNCKLAILHSRVGPIPVRSEFGSQTENSEEIVPIPDKDFSRYHLCFCVLLY